MSATRNSDVYRSEALGRYLGGSFGLVGVPRVCQDSGLQLSRLLISGRYFAKTDGYGRPKDWRRRGESGDGYTGSADSARTNDVSVPSQPHARTLLHRNCQFIFPGRRALLKMRGRG